MRHRPRIAAQLATRLLAAGRAVEALDLVENAEHDERGWPDFEFEDARIAMLKALGKPLQAQTALWPVFEWLLSVEHLRTYIAELPDFTDPAALDQASELVFARAEDLDGNQYEILTPAAEALAAQHPLAATLLLRAMIDFTLVNARSSRYHHAARHLMDCTGLAGAIAYFGAVEPHGRLHQPSQA